jgi:predicted glycosyl hydrolase (DUF1957 family)
LSQIIISENIIKKFVNEYLEQVKYSANPEELIRQDRHLQKQLHNYIYTFYKLRFYDKVYKNIIKAHTTTSDTVSEPLSTMASNLSFLSLMKSEVVNCEDKILKHLTENYISLLTPQ